ncbi:MAG: 3-phosphoserine/phosphohydroxythreonine transaminase [Deltaproteobacteria bacterium]|nr:MAG: 3-phosphoserine/phosphohydroxythreonine transaminase [Deltaproteobacteria bacterium]
MATRPVNFSPGPAILAPPVLEQAARAVVALDGVGLSILEISHRSATFEKILADARDGIRRLMGVPDTHEILFLQGGARGQFAQLALNFLKPGVAGAYVDTGAWSRYALEEAGTLGETYALASSKEQGYTVLPPLAGLAPRAGTGFVHTTSNNTIYGTQWQDLPDFGDVPHICDMSSDIMSRPVDVSRFKMIYAGAQKNAGPSGVTLVIIDRDFMESARKDIPKIWQYRIQAKKGSMFNTPPTFAIYAVGLVTQWLEAQGGVPGITAVNEKKARLLYDAIDGSDGYYKANVAAWEHRSRMNVTWRLTSEELEKTFIAEAGAAGLSSLKGHRDAGGLRASLYNQLPLEGVERLVEFMQAFKKSH